MNEWCFNSSKNIHYFIPAITYKTRAPSVQSVNSQMLYVILIHKRVGKKKEVPRIDLACCHGLNMTLMRELIFFLQVTNPLKLESRKLQYVGDTSSFPN